MKLPLYQIDAFTGRVFAGNPAAVCPLEAWLPDRVMQAIALENNLSETAFLVPENGDYAIRWFTPAVEVRLCGHATLAAAHVIMNDLDPGRSTVRFHTRAAGDLNVTRDGELYVLDLPADPPRPLEPAPDLAAALGRRPAAVCDAAYLMAVYESEADVRALAPDMAALTGAHEVGVIATAPGREADFVSRFFAPAAGIPEDPVTGSAHCILTPFWADRLGKRRLAARQLSPRGGELICEHHGARVHVAGRAARYLEGTIHV
jgi:PhzF family phenazine biosynthesis protein